MRFVLCFYSFHDSFFFFRIKELEGEILLLRNELDTYRKKLQQYQPSTGTKPRGECIGILDS